VTSDLEDDRQIIQTWLVDEKCEHDEYLKISRKDFDECLAAERASLPESAIQALEDPAHLQSCRVNSWEEGNECFCDCGQEERIGKALREVKAWQKGGGDESS